MAKTKENLNGTMEDMAPEEGNPIMPQTARSGIPLPTLEDIQVFAQVNPLGNAQLSAIMWNRMYREVAGT